ncbi:hypothetical protein [Adhaeretor mobilis]|nr:hypothetical protein [Adhaeretor mobilis]
MLTCPIGERYGRATGAATVKGDGHVDGLGFTARQVANQNRLPLLGLQQFPNLAHLG